MYKFIAAATLAASASASPVSISLDTDLRGGNLKNLQGGWSHSYQGVNIAAEYDRNEHKGFLHKMRAGRNLFSSDDATLDADVTYNFANKAVGVECRADVQGLNLKVEHDTSDSSTAVEARYNLQDTDLHAEFHSNDGFVAAEASRDFDVSGNKLSVNPRFEMGGKLLKSKLRYHLAADQHVQADVSYGLDDQQARGTAEFGQGLDNGDHLTVKLDPEANEVSATLATRLGGSDSDPSWEINAAADYSKGASMADSLSVSAKRSWSF